jgi:hypothetical protein
MNAPLHLRKDRRGVDLISDALIESVRRRDNRLRPWQECEAEERECDEKWWSCFELIHGFSLFFPGYVDSAIAGLEEAKNLAGKVLRLIQDRLSDAEVGKNAANL